VEEGNKGEAGWGQGEGIFLRADRQNRGPTSVNRTKSGPSFQL
jgi:hypothetical protein